MRGHRGDRLEELGQQRRVGAGVDASDGRDADGVVGDRVLQRAADVVDRVAGEQAAVHDRARQLRERVVGVPALHARRDAGGAQARVVERQRRQACDGGGVERLAGVGRRERPQIRGDVMSRRASSDERRAK